MTILVLTSHFSFLLKCTHAFVGWFVMQSSQRRANGIVGSFVLKLNIFKKWCSKENLRVIKLIFEVINSLAFSTYTKVSIISIIASGSLA